MLENWSYLIGHSEHMRDRETIYRAGYDGDGQREFTFARYLSNGRLALAVGVNYRFQVAESSAGVMWCPVRPDEPHWLPCGRGGMLAVAEWWPQIETHCLFQYAWDPTVDKLVERLRVVGLEFLGLGDEVLYGL